LYKNSETTQPIPAGRSGRESETMENFNHFASMSCKIAAENLTKSTSKREMDPIKPFFQEARPFLPASPFISRKAASQSNYNPLQEGEL